MKKILAFTALPMLAVLSACGGEDNTTTVDTMNDTMLMNDTEPMVTNYDATMGDDMMLSNESMMSNDMTMSNGVEANAMTDDTM